jgi:hypothetical protein
LWDHSTSTGGQNFRSLLGLIPDVISSLRSSSRRIGSTMLPAELEVIRWSGAVPPQK